MRIPTLLGLILIIVALGLGIFLFKYNQELNQKTAQNFQPKNIQVSNISDTSATITWESDNLTTGSVIYKKAELNSSHSTFPGCRFTISKDLLTCLQKIISAGDNLSEVQDSRNNTDAKTHLTHFVELDNLNENTKYQYSIKSDRFTFPTQPLKLNTAKKVSDQKPTQKPVLGKIIDENSQPISEVLIFLEIPGAIKLATITSKTGSFLIPLALLYQKNLSAIVEIEDKTRAILTAQKGNSKSVAEINIPFEGNQLPPITLGKDLDLTEIAASPSSDSENYLDLNNDSQLNSVDLATVIKNFGRNPEEKEADVNKDGVVDQDDIDLIKEELK